MGSFFNHSAKKLKYKLPSPFLGCVPSMPCIARSRLLLLVKVEEVEPSVPSQIQPFPVISSSLICWNTVSASWRTMLIRFTLEPDSFNCRTKTQIWWKHISFSSFLLHNTAILKILIFKLGFLEMENAFFAKKQGLTNFLKSLIMMTP